MENQGFEEEHQPRIEGAVFSRQSSGHESRKYAFPPPRIDLLSPLSSSDGHVYEDVLPVVEDVSKPACPSPQDPRRSFDVVDCASRDEMSDREEISGFRRNLTLPFRRANDLEGSVASCSVRVTNREKNVHREVDEDVSTIATRAQSIDSRPNRRRRKKDCKHCRSKAAAKEQETDDREHAEESVNVLRRNRDNEHQRSRLRDSEGLEERNPGPGPGPDPASKPDDSLTVYTITEKIGPAENTVTLIEYERNHATEPNNKEDRALISPEKGRAGMRVNSIYSQDRWYAKEAPIFFTDVKEHGSFQRAYSLPVRTQTPSSQNRVNLRRSVRGEPPPHPARLRKHRHGWTLHFARPLEASGCTRSLVVLLILVLTLLGIGAVALYIVFEPEKLQMIQQYLKSSAASHSSHNNTLSAGTFLPSAIGGRQSDTSTASTTMTTTTATAALSSSTLIASVLLSNDQSFSEGGAPPVSDAETEATSVNSTRYCDDCLHGEVCVALVDEEVPVCRIGIDREDPTGCAGFCIVNKQKCHRLDVDAFRCVEIEHYCLDDEWTCSNTLCIPLNKHCDGHMNCYDHSDEYNCGVCYIALAQFCATHYFLLSALPRGLQFARFYYNSPSNLPDCDLETHFQCGNETSCLPLEKRCDGKIDCWDAADEINCTLACPSENEFTCSNGQCISKARFCDGLPDCVDRSDEPHGCQGRCNKHEFTCQNSRCIAKGMKCNGIDDCGDGTDERHCKDRFS